MKKLNGAKAVLFLGLVALCSCGTKKAAVSGSIDGNWKIIEVDGEKVADVEKTPTITFDTKANRVNGNAGCNNFFGGFTHKGNSLKFDDNMGATRMMCQNMKFEDKAFQAFPKVVAAKINGNQLLLQDANGKTLFVLEK